MVHAGGGKAGRRAGSIGGTERTVGGRYSVCNGGSRCAGVYGSVCKERRCTENGGNLWWCVASQPMQAAHGSKILVAGR